MNLGKFTWVMIVLGLSSFTYAQKQLKYVPRALNTSKTIPYVVNPQLSSGAQVYFAKEVIRPQTLLAIERATAPTAVPTQLPKELAHLTFLSGPQALLAYMPGWRSELRNVFTEKQLDVIAQTFKNTDALLFTLDEKGNWLAPAPHSTTWEYKMWFALVLDETQIKFTEPQLKTLFGKFARFDDIFTRLNLQSFLILHKRAPKTNAPGDEGKLARKVRYNLNKRDGRKMNPEVEKYVYTPRVTVVPQYGRPKRAPVRSPEQVWQELTQFIREHNGSIPAALSQDEYERKLRNTWDRLCLRHPSSNDPYITRLIMLHNEKVKEKAVSKTPQAIKDYLTQYRQTHTGQIPSLYSADATEKMWRRAWEALYRKYKNIPEEQWDESVLYLMQLRNQTVKKIAENKTPQEIENYLTHYMREHDGKIPSQHSKNVVEKSWRSAWDTFFYKYRSTPSQTWDETTRRLITLHLEKIKETHNDRTPQEILDYLTRYMQAHNGQVPTVYNPDPVAVSWRWAWNHVFYKYRDVPTEQLDAPTRQLVDLFAQQVQKIAEDKTPQEIWDYLIDYMAQHNGTVPLGRSQDSEERAWRSAWDFLFQKYKNTAPDQLDEMTQKLIELHREKIKPPKTPAQILEYVTNYIQQHNGKIPTYHNKEAKVTSWRTAWDHIVRKYKNVPPSELNDDIRQLIKLHRKNIPNL